LQKSLRFIPSKDGIQYFQDLLDHGFMNMKLRFRRGDLNMRVLQLARLISSVAMADID
jgi:hypothetical protein